MLSAGCRYNLRKPKSGEDVGSIILLLSMLLQTGMTLIWGRHRDPFPTAPLHVGAKRNGIATVLPIPSPDWDLHPGLGKTLEAGERRWLQARMSTCSFSHKSFSEISSTKMTTC